MNARSENIGARRLHTVLERLLEEISFSAPELTEREITIDAAYVHQRSGPDRQERGPVALHPVVISRELINGYGNGLRERARISDVARLPTERDSIQSSAIADRGAALYSALSRQDLRHQVRWPCDADSSDLRESFAQDIVLLDLVGINPVVVHGGGPQITELIEQARAQVDVSCAGCA